MKIDPTIKPVIGPAPLDEQARSLRSSTQTDGGTASTEVQLSPLTARLQAIQSSLGESEVVDAARVAEIKQAIAEGRFTVNAEAVADRLIDSVRQLIDKHSS